MLSPSNAAFVTHVQSMAKQIVEAEALVSKLIYKLTKTRFAIFTSVAWAVRHSPVTCSKPFAIN
jgi:hypothetical protein